MSKKQLSEKWKQIQANMALEGHFISDEILAQAAAEYESQDLDAQMGQAVALAKKSGRPLIDVFREVFKPKET